MHKIINTDGNALFVSGKVTQEDHDLANDGYEGDSRDRGDRKPKGLSFLMSVKKLLQLVFSSRL